MCLYLESTSPVRVYLLNKKWESDGSASFYTEKRHKNMKLSTEKIFLSFYFEQVWDQKQVQRVVSKRGRRKAEEIL